MKTVLIILSFMIFIAGTSSIVCAAIVFNPDNGHYYERVNEFITWDEANILAQSSTYLGLTGHLATITSAEEDQWIFNNFGWERIEYEPLGLFIGGYQETGHGWNPAAGWFWVTGENWEYTNWAPDEPNDGKGHLNDESGHSNALLYMAEPIDPDIGLSSVWNDTPFDSTYYGYIIEYEPTAIVPIPPSILLMSPCLISLFIYRKKFKY